MSKILMRIRCCLPPLSEIIGIKPTAALYAGLFTLNQTALYTQAFLALPKIISRIVEAEIPDPVEWTLLAIAVLLSTNLTYANMSSFFDRISKRLKRGEQNRSLSWKEKCNLLSGESAAVYKAIGGSASLFNLVESFIGSTLGTRLAALALSIITGLGTWQAQAVVLIVDGKKAKKKDIEMAEAPSTTNMNAASSTTPLIIAGGRQTGGQTFTIVGDPNRSQGLIINGPGVAEFEEMLSASMRSTTSTDSFNPIGEL